MQLPPEDLGRQMQQAEPDTLAALGASNKEDPALSTFPALFTLLKENQGNTPRLLLERITTLTLNKRPLLLICLAPPKPHILVL